MILGSRSGESAGSVCALLKPFSLIKSNFNIMNSKEATQKTKKVNHSAPVRLWVKAKFVGFRRSRVQQNTNQCLVKVQGLADRTDSDWYFGKRIVYIYKASSKNSRTNTKSKYRTIWGRISKAHGNNGLVIARFNTNLPPRAIGSTLRVMLYPQRA